MNVVVEKCDNPAVTINNFVMNVLRWLAILRWLHGVARLLTRITIPYTVTRVLLKLVTAECGGI